AGRCAGSQLAAETRSPDDLFEEGVDFIGHWGCGVAGRDFGGISHRSPRKAAMTASRLQLPVVDKEQRLIEIRREAEDRGRIDSRGIRPAGAPFPRASVETGYYGIPLLKRPSWTWEIPLYFFVGGAAGASAVIGAIASYTGADRRLVRH